MDFLKRLGGSVLDFAIFFGACYAAARLGVAPATLTAPASFVVFLAVVYGLTLIITESSIAWPFSELAGKIPVIGPGLYHEDAEGNPSGGLLTCPLCTGMWVGAALAALGVAMFPIGEGLAGMRDLTVHGLVGAGWSYAVHVVVDRKCVERKH